MNQSKKVILLVLLAAVLLAALVWVKKVVDEQKTAKEVESMPEENTVLDQQTAVETVWAKPMASQPKNAGSAVSSSPIRSSSAGDLTPEPLSMAALELESPLSFIQFLELPENSCLRSQEIDWRSYREYRRAFAKSPESVDN
jgi:hypothetical protein